MEDQDKYYITSNFNTITYLSLKYEIIKKSFSSPKTVYFHFERTSELEADVEKVIAGKVEVEVNKILDQAKRVKDMIWRVKEGTDRA